MWVTPFSQIGYSTPLQVAADRQDRASTQTSLSQPLLLLFISCLTPFPRPPHPAKTSPPTIKSASTPRHTYSPSPSIHPHLPTSSSPPPQPHPPTPQLLQQPPQTSRSSSSEAAPCESPHHRHPAHTTPRPREK